MTNRSRNLLIVVNGKPCTGKTTIGRKIAEELGLPFISRDSIKECLFDTLGWSNREHSKKMGIASYNIFYSILDSLLASGTGLVVESNFESNHASSKFGQLKGKYNFEIIQILCKTESDILFERFKNRAQSGERHPGHQDHLIYDEFRERFLNEEWEPIAIAGKLVEIDTTKWEKVNHQVVIDIIKNP